MAKRGADFQLTKDGSDHESGQDGAGPQKATAAVLARRKIIAGRKPGMRAAHSQSTSVGQSQAQSNIFGNIDPNIINGTSNQQNGFGNPFAHLNSGIPPSTAQQSIVPPSSGFNFSVNGPSSIKNPFEAGFGQSSSNGVGGFQGSLFSIPAATKPEPPEQKNTISVRINPPESDTALWAPHAPFLMNSNNNEQNQTQPSSTASSFGSTFTSAQQAAPPANPFASFGTQPTTSSSFSFGQTSTQTPQQQPASNPFASPFKSTSNLFGQTPSQAQLAQPVTTSFNLFGQSSSQAQQPQAASNIFGVPPVQTQKESSATKVPPSSSIFTQSQPAPQTQPVSNNLFSLLSTPQPQGTPQSQSTAPQTSPQREQPGSPDDTTMTTSPPAVVDGSNNDSNGSSISPTKSQPASTSLFGRIESATTTTSAANGPVNIFGISSSPNPFEHESDKYFGKLAGSSTNKPATTGLSGVTTTTTTSGLGLNADTGPSPFSGAATPNLFSDMGKSSQDISQPGESFTSRTSSSQSSSATPPKFNPFATLNKPASEVTAKPSLNESPFKFSSQSTPAPSIKPHSQINGFRPMESSGAGGRPNEAESTHSSASAVGPIPASSTDKGAVDLMPAVIPEDLTENERREYVTAYRIRSLNHSMSERLHKLSLRPLDPLEMEYYKKVQREIFAANGSPMSMPGVGGNPNNNPINNNNPTTNGPLTNGDGTARPQFNFPASGSSKRKADEQIVKESGSSGSFESVKKARNDDVSYPSLSSATSSQTSNLFASIANGTGSASKPFNYSSTTGTMFNSANLAPNSSASAPFTPSTEPAQSSTNLFQFKASNSDSTTEASTSSNFFAAKTSTAGITTDSQAPALTPGFKPTITRQSTSTLGNPSAAAAPTPTTSPFKFTPRAPTNGTNPPASSAGAAAPTNFHVPEFGAVSGKGFLSQFAQNAAKDQEKAEKEAKAKRKAEEFDSEEDDEEEWERKDAERERAKKEQIEEAAKKAPGFKLPSTSFPAAGSPAVSSKAPESAVTSKPDATKSSSLFEFKPQQSTSNASGSLGQPQNDNIFGYLSNQGSDAEGSKTGEADDEGSDEEEQRKSPSKEQSSLFIPMDKALDTSTSSSRSSSKSLFDRIETNADGTPKRDVQSKDQPKSLFSFTQTSTSQTPVVNPFSLSTSGGGTGNLFNFKSTPTSLGNSILNTPKKDKETTNGASSSSPQLDQTWKTDSPIKFGASSTAPSINFTAASPAKPTFSGSTLFGGQKPADNGTTKSASNIFGSSSNTSAPSLNIGAGFNFGGPPKSSLAAPSIFSSANTSRATSPGASTGPESAAEGDADDAAPPEAQLDIANARAGEENEDILFEVKAKASEHGKNPKTDNLEWITRGVGTLRVLKHKETGKCRMLVRGSPAGKIVLNTALMSGVDYKVAKDKMIMFMAANSEGGMGKWMVLVGKKEDAAKLQDILQENKGN